MTPALLQIRRLSKTFRTGRLEVHAVRDVSLDVAAGECMAVVGESGSGKSTIANMILGILRPSSGSVHFDGNPLPARRTLSHRRRIQLVQQNPLSSLNPNRTVGASLRLALDVHAIDHRSRRDFRVAQLLEEVGLSPEMASRSPAALSGGQRQRVAIARARACRSDLIVLDEPTSALDVIVQARILRLLNGLRSSQGLTYVFITHDLAVVRAVADRVAVLKRGALVEIGTTDQVFSGPAHPYTRQLIAASPVVTAEEEAVRRKLREDEFNDGP